MIESNLNHSDNIFGQNETYLSGNLDKLTEEVKELNCKNGDMSFLKKNAHQLQAFVLEHSYYLPNGDSFDSVQSHQNAFSASYAYLRTLIYTF